VNTIVVWDELVIPHHILLNVIFACVVHDKLEFSNKKGFLF